MEEVILLLGANLGDKNLILKQAIVEIDKEAGKVHRQSKVYQTPAWGFESGNTFYNQVIVISTKNPPHKLLSILKNIELNLGRNPLKKSINGIYQDRLIDIDILFYNQLILESRELTIPHPRLHLRKFTLVPLNDLFPDFIHPVFRKSIHILLENCTDVVVPKVVM